MSGPKGVHTSRIFRAEAHLSEACPAVCSKIIASTAFTSKTTINVRYTHPKKKFCIGMYWVCSCLHIHFGRPDQEVFK